MDLIGTIKMPDGSTQRLEAHGETYEGARTVLEDLIPEGTKLIAIRVDR